MMSVTIPISLADVELDDPEPAKPIDHTTIAKHPTQRIARLDSPTFLRIDVSCSPRLAPTNKPPRPRPDGTGTTSENWFQRVRKKLHV